MTLTEKQKFWLIQFTKFALFSVIWFWAWLGPIMLEIKTAYNAKLQITPMFVVGIFAYPLILAASYFTDKILVRLTHSHVLSGLVLLTVEIVLLWQYWICDLLVAGLINLVYMIITFPFTLIAKI